MIWARLGQQRVHELVGQHEVDHGVHVGGRAEVLRVVAREGHVDAVVVVQHGGHAVEAEAVKPARWPAGSGAVGWERIWRQGGMSTNRCGSSPGTPETSRDMAHSAHVLLAPWKGFNRGE